MPDTRPEAPQPRLKPKTHWTAESVRRWFDDRTRSVAGERSVLSPHHRAASVLASFDPRQLRTPTEGPLETDRLSNLLSDCVAVPVVGAEAEGHGARWSLKPDVRREALASFPDVHTLRAALNWNDRPTYDPLQKALDAYILGPAKPIENQTLDQLAWSAQVVGWLSTTPFAADLGLPNPDDVRRRLDFVRLLAPLRRMANSKFHGREAEQRRLRDFLFMEAEPDLAPKPLMVHGFGGSGKTALVSKVLLDYAGGRLADRRGKRVARGPFVFLDFDRPSIVPEEPATLLLEAVHQIAAQSRETSSPAEALEVTLESLLRSRSAERSIDTLDLGRLLTGSLAANIFNAFGDLFRTPEWGKGKIPILFVLDTFEQVQYHSQKVVEHVWSFLGDLS